MGRFLLGIMSRGVKANSEAPARIFNGESGEIEDVDEGLLS